MQSVDSNGGRSGINTIMKLAHSAQLTPKDMLGQYHKFKYEAQQDARIKNQTAMRKTQRIQNVMHAYNEGMKNVAKENATRVRAGQQPVDNPYVKKAVEFTKHAADDVEHTYGWGKYKNQRDSGGDGGSSGSDGFWGSVKDHFSGWLKHHWDKHFGWVNKLFGTFMKPHGAEGIE